MAKQAETLPPATIRKIRRLLDSFLVPDMGRAVVPSVEHPGVLMVRRKVESNGAHDLMRSIAGYPGITIRGVLHLPAGTFLASCAPHLVALARQCVAIPGELRLLTVLQNPEFCRDQAMLRSVWVRPRRSISASTRSLRRSCCTGG